MLREEHGQEFDDLRQARFDYEIDGLSVVQSSNLSRHQPVAAIEDFLAQATVETRGCGRDTAIGRLIQN